MSKNCDRKIFFGADFMVSALGVGTEQNAEAILRYESGIEEQHGLLAAHIDWTKIPEIEGFTRIERLMIFAIEQLKTQVSLDFSAENVGLIVSTTKGNIDLLAAENFSDNRLRLNELALRIADRVGLTTEPIVVSNACISGISAQIVAARLVAQRKFDHIIVCGADLLTDFVVSGFQSFKSVSAKRCLPYDSRRDGLSMGEACGAVLITADEKLAGEQKICLLGGAITNDANHISGPSRTGDGLAFAIEKAMLQANISADDLAFVSAHGTATIYNDEMECKALNLSHLLQVLTNSLKPYIGHTLGACGVIETILAAWQLRHQVAFGTLGFESLGVPFDMTVSAAHQPLKNSSACLKIASGFGGCNAALVLSAQQKSFDFSIKNVQFFCKKIVSISGNGDFAERIRAEYRELNAANLKFFKMDDLSKLGYVCAEKLLIDSELPTDPTRTAVVLSNRSGSLDTDLRHQKLLNSGEPVSPAVFVYTLSNIVSGEICIRHHIKGENTFFVQANSAGFARVYAENLLQNDIADAVIFGWCELLGDYYCGDFELLKKK